MDKRAKLGLSVLTIFAALVLLAVATRTYPPRTGTLFSTGAPVAARFAHTATPLANDTVLIAGGMERNGVWLDSAEIYDPASGRFTPTGNMLSRRAGAMAALLPGGKVLIAGGADGSGKSLPTTEIYDPLTGRFYRGPNMNAPRSQGVAVLLNSGKVLIAGGCAEGDDDRLASAELYDPSAGTFSFTGSMHTPRGYFNAVALLDGRVLVAGGIGNGELSSAPGESSAEIYDPATERFTVTGSMSVGRFKHGMTLLDDGRAMIVGGQNGGAYGPKLTSTELYDPATGRFSRGPEMKNRRYKLAHGIVTLKDGRVLIGGGADQTEIYEPGSNSFVSVPGPALDGFLYSTVTALHGGKVLLVDGYGKHPAAGAVRQAWIWQP